MKKILKSLLKRILSWMPAPSLAPGLYLRWRAGWLKGLIYRAYFFLREKITGARVTIGKGFSVQGSLRVRGPGSIAIGDFVIIDAKTDLYTHSSTAKISIGNRTFLNGTRMGCEQSISISSDCIIADVRILDTDFHSLHKSRHDRNSPIGVAPVVIEENVWISAAAAVLKGVTVGAHSVVAFGSIVTKDVPPMTIVGGNPAKAISVVPE